MTTIYHIFADHGVESEVLDAYGRVVRIGLDAIGGTTSEAIKADAHHLPLKPGADLAVLHPPCTRYADMTSISGNPEDHPNLIPLAREIGKEYADEYIIENKPRAPLRNPVRLKGDMFGIPIEYERAFETSFHVEQPAIHMTLGNECSPYFYSDRSKDWWRSVKGYREKYSDEKTTLAKNCVPAAYVHYLMRAWLRSTNDVDGQEVAGHSAA